MSLNDNGITNQSGGEIFASEIYEELGWTLAAWGAVEGMMARIFGVAISFNQNERAARRAFWAVASFEAKLKMLHVVLRDFEADHFPDANTNAGVSAEWAKIHSRLTKKNKIRNKLAHGVVRGMEWCGPGSTDLKRDVFFLPFGNSHDDKFKPRFETESECRRHLSDPRPKERMKKQDIIAARQSINEIENQLFKLNQVIVSEKVRIAGLEQKDDDRPTG